MKVRRVTRRIESSSDESQCGKVPSLDAKDFFRYHGKSYRVPTTVPFRRGRSSDVDVNSITCAEPGKTVDSIMGDRKGNDTNHADSDESSKDDMDYDNFSGDQELMECEIFEDIVKTECAVDECGGDDANTNIPSLETIKRFVLPNFVPPTMCTSSNAIDFYINLPSTFIRNCFSNPSVSSNIVRIPVIAKKHITYFMLRDGIQIFD
uniref:Uncharacterized protein n=1 Tax=Amphimedon queenslandica TaxID=400682 RepID=A0A1X7V463_AMPQE